VKSKYLVLAVAAAMPFTSWAQSSVQLFGVADAGLASVNRGAGGAIRVDSGFNSTSRWGVRGSEDLGGGLKAFFKLESEVEVDQGLGGDGGPLNFVRGAYVGLEGGFGQVWMGRDYQSGFFALQAVDINAYGLYGNLLTFLSGYQAGGGFAASAGMQTRTSNGIYWKSPNWGGFEARAHYGLGERDVDPKTAGNAAGLALFYSAGPLSLAGWYHDRKVLAGTTTTGVKEFGGGGIYNFGRFRVSAGFGAGDPEGPRKTTFSSLGASTEVGAGTVSAQLINLKEAASAGKGRSLSLSYTYPMSKRSNFYASIGQTKNNDTGNFLLRSAGNTSAPSAIGNDPRGIVVGIRHVF
jgi:predicted porin